MDVAHLYDGNDGDEEDEGLYAACESLNVGEVRRLLESGEADASSEAYEEGHWMAGSRARRRVSAVHGLLRAEVVSTNDARVEQILRLMLEHGASLAALKESYDGSGEGMSVSGTDMLVRFGNVGLMRVAMEYKALSPNQSSVSVLCGPGLEGRQVGFPLHSAVAKGDCEAVELLLLAGADVDARQTQVGESEFGDASDTSETALHLAVLEAARRGPCGEAVVRALLEGGADPNALRKWLDNVDMGKKGFVNIRNLETPLMLAVKLKQPRVAAMLLMYGAQPGVQCTRGQDSLDLFETLKNDSSSDARETIDVLSMNLPPHLYHLLPHSVKREARCLLACIKRSCLPPLPSPVLNLVLTSLLHLTLCKTSPEHHP